MANGIESAIADDSINTALGGDIVGKQTGTSSTLSPYVGPYVTEDVLAEGAAAADMPYEAYTGELTAGESDLQTDAFTGLAALTVPTEKMGVFTPTSFTDADAQTYMNPFYTNVVQDQIDELNKQAEIRRLANASRMTRAGSYGGSRQGVLEGTFEAALLDDISDAVNKGNVDAYNQAIAQFNIEQDRGKVAQEYANQYGIGLIGKQAELGGIQRGITQEGVEADIAQFEEERDYDIKMPQYKASLLEGLPIETQQYAFATPNELSKALGLTGGIMDLYEGWYGGAESDKNLNELQKALDDIGIDFVDGKFIKKSDAQAALTANTSAPTA